MQTDPGSDNHPLQPGAQPGQARSQTTLGLISDVPCLQNAILLDQLQEKLDVPCSLAKPEQIGEYSLVLLDCASLDTGRMQTILHSAKDCLALPKFALINTAPHSSHEILVHCTGVNGIFYLSADQNQLVMGIREILRGDYWLPRRLLYQFLEGNRRTPAPGGAKDVGVKLTRREKEILKCIQEGATNAEISALLFVSEHTIKSHLYNTFKKIGVKNRMEAGNWARTFL